MSGSLTSPSPSSDAGYEPLWDDELFGDMPPDFATQIRETLDNHNENSDDLVDNNLGPMNTEPRVSDSHVQHTPIDNSGNGNNVVDNHLGLMNTGPQGSDLHAQQTPNDNSGNEINVVDNNRGSMNFSPQVSDNHDWIDFGRGFNHNSGYNNDLINTGWMGTGPQAAQGPTWRESGLEDPFGYSNDHRGGQAAIQPPFHNHGPQVVSNPLRSGGYPPQTYNDPFGYINDHSGRHAAIQLPSYNQGPQAVLNPPQLGEHPPQIYNERFDVHGRPHYLPQQSGYGQLPNYNYIAPTADRDINSGDPLRDQAQLHSDQDAEGEDDSYDAYRGRENSVGGEGEGEEEDEEEEEEESDVDDDEFVVSDITGMANIEKPGKVRKDNGYLEWYDARAETWHRAVVHHNIRKALIKEAQAKHPNQRYLHPDPAGTGPSDITAFHAKYQTWGLEREDRPPILFQFDAPQDKQLRAPRPGPMKFRGKIVLNHQNNPVLDWNLPATLSSKTSGSNMEAWKRLLGIGQEDMRARMVRYTNEMVDGEMKRVALPDKNATVNMPMQRFRDRAGCIAWSKRPGSDTLRASVISLMQREGFDPTITGSTEDFGRDFSANEQALVKKDNKGGAPQKARNYKPEEKGKRKRSSAVDGGNDSSPQDLIDLSGADLSTAYQAPLGASGSLQARKRTRREGTAHHVSGDHSEPPVNLVQRLRAQRREQREKRPRRSQRKATRVLRHTQLEDSDDDDDEMGDTSGSEFSEDSEMSGDDINVQPGNEDDTILEASASMFPTQPVIQNSRRENFPRHAVSSSQSGRLPQSVSQARPLVPAFRESFSGHIENEDLLNHRRNIDNLLSGPVSTVPDNSQPPLNRRNLNRKSRVLEDETTVQPIPTQHRFATSLTAAGNDFLPEAEDTLPNSSRPLKKRHDHTGKSRAREDQVNPQPVSTQHRSTASRPTAGNVDCRQLSPMTEAERRAIEGALIATHEAFFEFTGYVAPVTNRNTSYSEQWEAIYEAFLQFNWTGHPRNVGGQPPFLPQLPAWYTSIEDKPEHVKDSMFYEAWIYGFRAPRHETTGELIVMNGEFLESIGKLDDGMRKYLLDRALESKGFAPADDEEEDSEEEEEL